MCELGLKLLRVRTVNSPNLANGATHESMKLGRQKRLHRGDRRGPYAALRRR